MAQVHIGTIGKQEFHAPVLVGVAVIDRPRDSVHEGAELRPTRGGRGYACLGSTRRCTSARHACRMQRWEFQLPITSTYDEAIRVCAASQLGAQRLGAGARRRKRGLGHRARGAPDTRASRELLPEIGIGRSSPSLPPRRSESVDMPARHACALYLSSSAKSLTGCRFARGRHLEAGASGVGDVDPDYARSPVKLVAERAPLLNGGGGGGGRGASVGGPRDAVQLRRIRDKALSPWSPSCRSPRRRRRSSRPSSPSATRSRGRWAARSATSAARC